MERLKTAGLWGLAIAFFIVMLPISVVLFVITTKLMFLFLGSALPERTRASLPRRSGRWSRPP
jgi:hypothetical protein